MSFARESALRSKAGAGSSAELQTWLIGAGFLLPCIYLFLHQQFNVLVAIMALSGAIILWLRNHAAALVFLFCFLVLLGDIRRVVDLSMTARGLDPLLVVGSAFAIYVAVPLVFNLRLTDLLSKLMLALMAMMILEIFNPRQGPLIVGVSGALFYIAPLLWFWIARTYATERIMFLLLHRVFLPLGVLDGLMGIYQTYIGLFPWQEDWVHNLGAQYVFRAGHYRSFGFSTGGAEYSSTMLIATICIVAAIFAKRRVYALLLPVILAATLLASSRGGIVKLFFAACVIWAVRGKGARVLLPRLIFALAVGAAVIYYTASQAASPDQYISKRASTSQIATNHVAQGFTHPLDARYASGGIHAGMFYYGLLEGFTYPIGRGLGATTLASGKFGGDQTATGSSEVDISDIFVSLGFVGGLLYIVIICLVLRLAWKYVRKGSPILSFTVIGLLAGSFGAWIPLGQYSVGPIIWFCIGALVKRDNDSSLSEASKSKEHAVATGERRTREALLPA